MKFLADENIDKPNSNFANAYLPIGRQVKDILSGRKLTGTCLPTAYTGHMTGRQETKSLFFYSHTGLVQSLLIIS